MKNILTFDIEEWYHANFSCIENNCFSEDSNFERNMHTIFDLCDEYSCKATFFTLGCIAENYKNIVKEIVSRGHELASHGSGHELAYNQTEIEFEADVKASIDILEDISGKKVQGYRAPSWSITKKNLHYLKILEKLGLRYDASVFPTENFMYGISDFERQIHRPIIDGKQISLIEVPTSVFNFFDRGMGYSGGFYLRALPAFFIKSIMKKTNKQGMPAIVYLHPREIDVNENRLKLPFVENLIHYYNVGGTKNKLKTIFKDYNFTAIKDYLDEKNI